MVEVVEATQQMYPEILKLLHQFNNPNISDNQWRRLLDYPWKKSSDIPGFVMRSEGQIVGFLGTVYSEKKIKDKTERVCNLTSWIVEPEYRKESFELWRKAYQTGLCTFTALTVSQDLYPFYLAFGFKPLDSHYRLCWTFPHACRGIGKVFKVEGDWVVRLTQEEKRVFGDHKELGCEHVTVTDGTRHAYVIYTVRKSKGYRLAKLHYVSDPALLRECFGNLGGYLFRSGICRMAWDERVMGESNNPTAKRVNLTIPGLYFSKTLGPENLLDTYSEVLLLASDVTESKK